jgi:hypothetical protein
VPAVSELAGRAVPVWLVAQLSSNLNIWCHGDVEHRHTLELEVEMEIGRD